MPTTFSVSNASQLSSALAQASGGDTIELASGNYGDIDIKNVSFDSYVTITSADGNKGANLNSLDIANSSYVRIDNVHIDNSSNGGPGSKIVEIVENSHHIEFVNNEVNGKIDDVYVGFIGVFVDHSSNIKVSNNYIHDVKNGSVNWSVTDLEVSENHVDYIAEDAFKFAGVKDFLVENNSSFGHVYPIAGSHLDFIQFQSASSNGTIRGNTLLVSGVAWIQGIFMDDAPYHGVTIEQNILYTGMANGIIISEGSGNTVRNNTVLNAPDLVHPVTNISIASGSIVENNISASTSGGISGSNVKVQHTDPNGPYYYGDLFENATKGLGITFADLAPVDGSLSESKGAYLRLAELLDLDTGVEPPSDGDDNLHGDAGDNSITGSSGSDDMSGGDGDDMLDGSAGDDTIYGGTGDDFLQAGAGDDLLNGEAGRDVLKGSEGNDDLYGGKGGDSLSGGRDNDDLDGAAGNDRLSGGKGNDALDGGNGNDNMDGGEGDDAMVGGAGSDMLSGGSGDDAIEGGAGNETIYGGHGMDIIDGGRNDDMIFGGGNDDTIFGGNGDDVIDGGTGDDTMSGGGGADRFVFEGQTDNDLVVDFEIGVDKIDVSDFGLSGFADISSAISTSGSDIVIDLSAVGGDGLVTISNVAGLDASDFIF